MLPASLKQKANEWVDSELNENRSVEWAINYHRKLVLMIKKTKERGEFYSEYEGDVCLSLKLGIDLEVENALRALINRIRELEALSEKR